MLDTSFASLSLSFLAYTVEMAGTWLIGLLATVNMAALIKFSAQHTVYAMPAVGNGPPHGQAWVLCVCEHLLTVFVWDCLMFSCLIKLSGFLFLFPPVVIHVFTFIHLLIGHWKKTYWTFEAGAHGSPTLDGKPWEGRRGGKKGWQRWGEGRIPWSPGLRVTTGGPSE